MKESGFADKAMAEFFKIIRRRFIGLPDGSGPMTRAIFDAIEAVVDFKNPNSPTDAEHPRALGRTDRMIAALPKDGDPLIVVPDGEVHSLVKSKLRAAGIRNFVLAVVKDMATIELLEGTSRQIFCDHTVFDPKYGVSFDLMAWLAAHECDASCAASLKPASGGPPTPPGVSNQSVHGYSGGRGGSGGSYSRGNGHSDRFGIHAMLAKIDPKEPFFILRGQDAFAAALIATWADLAASAGVSDAKVQNARMCARAARHWPTKKIPD